MVLTILSMALFITKCAIYDCEWPMSAVNACVNVVVCWISQPP